MYKPFILVVDDNKITTKLLRRYLEANGYDAIEAYDGVDCLEKVEQKHPDAIVLDVMMPRMDGYETVKRLKDNPETAHIPVVIVTALNDVPNQLKSIDAGADDFLSKPIEEKLLIAKVKMLSNLNINSRRASHFEQLIKKAVDGEITVDDLQQEII
ncbi:MAG: response regulator [Candidatus Kapabacteria bacterium]|nr:response regulator [Ignavibacteriota bacterium]MCW5885411.1 response regulator [Candidatus Kapabacteria bacterium]